MGQPSLTAIQANPILGNAYMRYDCSTNVMYLLILKTDDADYLIVEDGNEVYLKVDDVKVVSSDDEDLPGQPTFDWINFNEVDSTADGWEASFSLSDGSHSLLFVHSNMWYDGESQTTSTDKDDLDLVIECAGIDYGDAPIDAGFNYGAAGHHILSGLPIYMGAQVDDESGHTGDPLAGTDDGDGDDDEDGVSFFIQNTDLSWSPIDGSLFYKGRTYKVVVSTTLVGCTSAKLAAWFDFFVDGEFGNEPEETIIANVTIDNTGSSSITTTSHEYVFTVPAGSNEGTTYLRFRFDAQSDDLPPTGIGNVGGEVEDYVTNIETEPPVAVTLTSFSAIQTNEGVLVSWTVASEIGNAGYNIYKSASETGAREKMNDILIGNPENMIMTSGQSYHFIDDESNQTLAFYTLEAIAVDGSSEYYGPVQASIASAVDDQQTPIEFALEQNYPNPFNPSTTIEYAVPEPTSMTIVIYDIQGRAIKTLVNATHAAGSYSVVWDATNRFGEPVPSGLYIYRMHTSTFTKLSRMTLLK
jgi:hypothetical protein